MRYQGPVNEPENASYRDVNAAAGVEGSAVPARAIEQTMRELDHLIRNAGIEPSFTVMTQVRQAIDAKIAQAIGGITQQFDPGYIFGLHLSNVAGQEATHISLGTGFCRDRQRSRNVFVNAPLIKRLDQVWAPGNNAGGRFSDAAPRADGTYHVILLTNNANPAQIDVGFSNTETGAGHPTGWTPRRRVGSLLTDANGHWVLFQQLGDEFILRRQIRSSHATPPTARAFITLNVPTGITTMARVAPFWTGLPGLTTTYGLLTTTAHANIPPDANNFNLYGQVGQEAGQAIRDVQCPVTVLRADSLRRVALRVSAARGIMSIFTQGWFDTRNREFG